MKRKNFPSRVKARRETAMRILQSSLRTANLMLANEGQHLSEKQREFWIVNRERTKAEIEIVQQRLERV